VAYAWAVPLPRFPKRRAAKEEAISIGDPRLAGWETVSTFEDRTTALAWRDQLRGLGLDASCVADHPLDRFGRGELYLVVPPDQWSRANEVVENLDGMTPRDSGAGHRVERRSRPEAARLRTEQGCEVTLHAAMTIEPSTPRTPCRARP
jgi:hypothetical protein